MLSGEPAGNGPGRRLFLKAAGVFGFILMLPSRGWSLFIRRFPVRTVETGNFSFDPASGSVKWKDGRTEAYQLVVEGLVEKPVTLSYQDLRNLPRTEQVSDFHCVEGWSVGDLRWAGFRFEELLKKISPKPEAKYAVFHSLGTTGSKPRGQAHYLESFPLEKLVRPEAGVLLVLDLDGRPLPDDHGAPLRVISPYDLGYKSIKYVTRIELTARETPGWWTLANPIYPIDAPVPAKRLRKK